MLKGFHWSFHFLEGSSLTLRRSKNQNFEKAKYIMENFSENDNFNELLAIKTVTGEKYSKIKTLNKVILNILLKEGDNDKEIEI